MRPTNSQAITMRARNLIATDILLTVRRYLCDKQLNGEVMLDMRVKPTLKSLGQAHTALTEQGRKCMIGKNQLGCIGALLLIVKSLRDTRIKSLRLPNLTSFLESIGSNGSSSSKSVRSFEGLISVQFKPLKSLAGNSKLANHLQRLAARIQQVLENDKQDLKLFIEESQHNSTVRQLVKQRDPLAKSITTLKAKIRELGSEPQQSVMVSIDSRPGPHMDDGEEDTSERYSNDRYHSESRISHEAGDRIALKLAMTVIRYLSHKNVNTVTMLEHIGAITDRDFTTSHIKGLQRFLYQLGRSRDGKYYVPNKIPEKHRTFLKILANSAAEIYARGMTFGQLETFRDVLRNAGKVEYGEYRIPGQYTTYQLRALRSGRGKSELAERARDLAFDLEKEIIQDLDESSHNQAARAELSATVIALMKEHAALKAQYSELSHYSLTSAASDLDVSIMALIDSLRTVTSKIGSTHPTPPTDPKITEIDGEDADRGRDDSADQESGGEDEGPCAR